MDTGLTDIIALRAELESLLATAFPGACVRVYILQPESGWLFRVDARGLDFEKVERVLAGNGWACSHVRGPSPVVRLEARRVLEGETAPGVMAGRVELAAALYSHALCRRDERGRALLERAAVEFRAARAVALRMKIPSPELDALVRQAMSDIAGG